jgi:hypothetical protein
LSKWDDEQAALELTVALSKAPLNYLMVTHPVGTSPTLAQIMNALDE